MQVLGYLLTLTGGEFLTGDLHQVGTQPVLIAVHGGLRLRHGPEALVAVLMHQRHGGQQILHGALSHGVGDLTALLDGQRRVLQEALLQTVHLLALPAALGVVRHQHTYQLLQQADEGHQATTVARRNRVFARAMDTVVMVVSMKSKCTTALTA